MRSARFPLAAALLGLAAWLLSLYPLPPWPVAGLLLAYGVALWRWPAAFLLVLPVVLPALHLTLQLHSSFQMRLLRGGLMGAPP
ncbi:MAG: hypothetical protein ACJ8AI_35405 [Rhodopila sp.]